VAGKEEKIEFEGEVAEALSNGNYVVSSYGWNGGFGAVTWGNGLSGTVGAVTSANSLVGSTTFDNVGSSGGFGNFVELSNGNFVVSSYGWGSAGGYGDGKGAVTWMNGTNGKLADGTSGGAISATNSLVGSTLGDLVGSSCDCSSSGYVIGFSNGNYAVISPSWTNGLLSGAGAATLGNGATGTVGTVSASNSLVGTAASEHLGNGAFELIGQPGRVLIANAAANNGKGGVYLLGGSTTLVTGLVGGALPFSDNADASISAALIASTLNAGTNVVLQANNDITQMTGAAINATGTGNLTLQAVHSVVLNDTINIKGTLDITANDSGRTCSAIGNRCAGYQQSDADGKPGQSHQLCRRYFDRDHTRRCGCGHCGRHRRKLHQQLRQHHTYHYYGLGQYLLDRSDPGYIERDGQ